MYGVRQRADAYPHVIYRVASKTSTVVEQLVHGRFWHSGGTTVDWIEQQLEKGLVWKLENGLRDWDARGKWPGYVAKVDLTIFAPNHAAIVDIASARLSFGEVLQRHGAMEVSSLTHYEQRAPWHVLVGSSIDLQNNTAAVSATTCSLFNRREAGEKKYASGVQGIEHTVKVSYPVQHSKHDQSWDEVVRRAAYVKLQGLEEENKRAAKAEVARVSFAHKANIRRLAELVAIPTCDLTTKQYREKMKLKRELRNVS